MRYLTLLIVLIFGGVTLAEERIHPAVQKEIEAIKIHASEKNLIEVGMSLRAEGIHRHGKSNYMALQRALLSIPGHAQYFADAIRREQAAVKHIPFNVGERITYDRNRDWYIRETLRHLPSPETIRVLGEFLSDDLDKPEPAKPGEDWDNYPANSVLSAQALVKIGLRNPPSTQAYQDEKNIMLWREWYAKVKSGELAFSFDGQNVEYRFNADGSVTQRPYLGPTDNSSTQPEKSEPSATPPASVEKTIPWYFWLGGALALLSGLWLWLKRTSHKQVR